MRVTPLVLQSHVAVCSKDELRSTTWTELSSARLRFSEGGGLYLYFLK
jgi:hypothetical protein